MILGYIVAIIALILIIMRAFNLNWGIIPITIYSHQVVFIGIILSLIGVFLKNRVHNWFIILSKDD